MFPRKLATSNQKQASWKVGRKIILKLTVDGVFRLCSKNSTNASKVRAPV